MNLSHPSFQVSWPASRVAGRWTVIPNSFISKQIRGELIGGIRMALFRRKKCSINTPSFRSSRLIVPTLQLYSSKLITQSSRNGRTAHHSSFDSSKILVHWSHTTRPVWWLVGRGRVIATFNLSRSGLFHRLKFCLWSVPGNDMEWKQEMKGWGYIFNIYSWCDICWLYLYGHAIV